MSITPLFYDAVVGMSTGAANQSCPGLKCSTQQQPGTTGQPLRCFSCEQAGHITKDCLENLMCWNPRDVLWEEAGEGAGWQGMVDGGGAREGTVHM